MADHFFCKDNLESLVNDLYKKQTVFFVGAGINQGGGKDLSWDALLNYLFDEALTFIAAEKEISGESLKMMKKAFKPEPVHNELKVLPKAAMPDFSPIVKVAVEKEICGDLLKIMQEAFKWKLNHSGRFSKDWKALHKAAMQDFSPLVKVSVEREMYGDLLKIIQEAFKSKLNHSGKFSTDWKVLHKAAMQDFSPLVKASIVKEILGPNYITSIQYFLYNRCNSEILRKVFHSYYSPKGVHYSNVSKPYYSLYKLASLIIRYSTIKAVVTYNFDNLLSEAIRILWENRETYFQGIVVERENMEVLDVAGTVNEADFSRNAFPVYHVHGYIPPPNELSIREDESIVLTMEEFYDNVSRTFSWQTSTPMHFLCHYTCVFVGLSLTDINSQRMIHYAGQSGNNEKLYNLTALTVPEEESEKCKEAYMALCGIKNMFYRKCGLLPVFHEKGYVELWDELERRLNEKNK